MALRTLVEVPSELDHVFVKVLPYEFMVQVSQWDESWPEWAKKDPRVPVGIGVVSRADLEDFASAHGEH